MFRLWHIGTNTDINDVDAMVPPTEIQLKLNAI